MILDFVDLNSFLKSYLEINQLSYRSFSKRANIDPSLLSRVLKKERSFSYRDGLSMVEYFKFSKEEEEYFLLLLEYEMVSTQKAKDLLKKEISSLHLKNKKVDIREDQFDLIGDYQTFVILSLLEMKPLKEEEITSILKGKREKTLLSLERLIKAELVLKNSSGLYMKASQKRLHFKINNTNDALHDYFKETLKRVYQEIDEGDPEKRTFRVKLTPVPKGTGKIFTKMLDKFLMDFYSHFEQTDKEKEELICLNINYFKLFETRPSLKETREKTVR